MQSIAMLDVQKLDLRFLCSSLPLCQGANIRSGTLDLFLIAFQLLDEAAMLIHLRLLACSLQSSLTAQFNNLEKLYLDLVPMGNEELLRISSSCVNHQTLRVAYCKLLSFRYLISVPY